MSWRSPPETMSRPDEHVPIDDFLHVLRTHTLAAYDYLTDGPAKGDRARFLRLAATHRFRR